MTNLPLYQLAQLRLLRQQDNGEVYVEVTDPYRIHVLNELAYEELVEVTDIQEYGVRFKLTEKGE